MDCESPGGKLTARNLHLYLLINTKVFYIIPSTRGSQSDNSCT